MFKFIKRIFYSVIILVVVLVVLGRFFNPIITITQAIDGFRYGKLERDYIPFDQMGDQIKKAVIASEDQKFYLHKGFDLDAISDAMKHNEKGKSIRGGSTISQQTAKNIFLWNGRSWIRKGLETVFTFIIENTWSKNIILERYLNCIEMGQGVFGIEAAAQYYYDKSAKDLTKNEAAWIAVILPSPKKHNPKNPTSYLKKKHNWVLKQMNNVQLK